VKPNSDENDDDSAHGVTRPSDAANEKKAYATRTQPEDKPRLNFDDRETAKSTPHSQPSTSGEHGASGGSRRLDFPSTRLGIVASIATILGLIVAVVALIAQWPRSSSTAVASQTTENRPVATHSAVSPVSHPQSLTANVVRQALLDSSELAAIDSSLKESDLQPSSATPSAACKGGTTHPLYNPARLFVDGHALGMYEEIDAFPSQKAAQIAFIIDSKTLTCGIQFVRNISGQIAGLCDESYGAEALVSKSGYQPAASYSAILRCGRFVLAIFLETLTNDTFEQVGKFELYAQIAVPKVLALPGG
jgi:hypothetical protein